MDNDESLSNIKASDLFPKKLYFIKPAKLIEQVFNN